MVLQLFEAGPEDVEIIASVHLAAFHSNTLLHAQFPSPESLTGLHAILSQEMLSTIQSGQECGKAILVVRDTEADHQIISFAKWELPTLSKKEHHPGVTWPSDCRQEYLDLYFEKAEAAKSRVVGEQPCYRLEFVGTLPEFQGRGAGTLLTQWAVSRAKRESIPVYLESTIAALPLYRRLGFVPADGLSMTLPGDTPDGAPQTYTEVGMLHVWEEEDSGMDHWDSSLCIESLLQDYEAGIKPQVVVQAIFDRIDAYKSIQPSVWTWLQPLGEVMQAANELYTRWPDSQNRPPLWGVPFSVKDSIDVAGVPTTIACPALAFTPTTSAPVYQRCLDAGGILIGKTNMEQLATGMTGCRSPFGTLHSTFSNTHCVGGSSSGGAVTVSEGLVSFALGSDTAGSIRVPALFNSLNGFKPTKGTVSARGVYPASAHQDCVSFLTTTTEDAERVWNVCKGFDKLDVFAKLPPALHSSQQKQRPLKFQFGIPPEGALAVCTPTYRKLFAQAIQILSEQGGKLIDMDWKPFSDANELLYNSSFVLERLTILPDGWFEKNKEQLHPVTRKVFEGALARNSMAVDVFKDLAKQAQYKRAVEDILKLAGDPKTGEDIITLLVVPTTPFHPTIEEVSKDPIGINGELGIFAHFANVLDLVAIAMPCGTYEVEDESEGKKVRLPFGVTILAGAGLDEELLCIAKLVEDALREVGDDA